MLLSKNVDTTKTPYLLDTLEIGLILSPLCVCGAKKVSVTKKIINTFR